MESPSKTVLLVVKHGQGARLLLQTQFLPLLQSAGVRVVVLTPGKRLPTVAPSVQTESLIVESLRSSSAPPAGRITSLLRTLVKTMRRAALDGRKSPLIAIRYRNARAAYSEVWPRWLSLLVHGLITQLLWRSGPLRRLVCRLDVWLSVESGNAEVFRRYRPDLVIGAGLGYFSSDEVIFQEAARRGVSTAALVSGWDNPTSKGYRAASLDLVVAWSERMREEIVRLHDIHPDRVKVGGVPHWDHYLIPDALPTRDELCSAFGLDVTKRVVFHTASPPADGDELEMIATTLAEATGSGEFGDDVQLVIRLHPSHMKPRNEQARRPYEALARLEGVHLNYPDLVEAGPLREPSLEDGRALGALLKHCDVLVNVFSTTTLEACLLDRPVVMAMPGPSRGKYRRDSHLASPLFWTDYIHLQPLVDGRATRVAHSGAELIEQVRRYLEDPSVDRARRRAIAQLECGPTDGRAGERTARFVLDQLGVNAPSNLGRAFGEQAHSRTPPIAPRRDARG